MKTTDKIGCNLLVELLERHGVRRVVLSPGSRNAPLLMAFSRSNIQEYVVVDERSAAFMALGMAQRSDEPVALVCTSGTALLNYAPAVAEAYYQHLPLVVISADRPMEWIDQDDSQTLHQPGALSHVVKQSYYLKAELSQSVDNWYFNRCVNEAMLTALSGERGPVHINISVAEPLTREVEYSIGEERIISRIPSAALPDEESIRLLTEEFASARQVLILVAFAQPDPLLSKALARLAKLPQVVVLTESIANVQGEGIIPTIDRVYTTIDSEELRALTPDLLITLGGSLVSRMIKSWLRENRPQAHWRISQGSQVIDTLQSLTRHIEAEASYFLETFSQRVFSVESDYARRWHAWEEEATRRHNAYLAQVGWCDMKAFSMLLPAIPEGVSLQLSNGTTIRYAQLFPTQQVLRCHCNRGVSGIDGSTSTAVGASCVGEETTLLVTGDMSFIYDINGLASGYLSPRFKMIVICNGGGGIFRFIRPTRDLPELESCFEVHRELPMEKYADLFGLRYFEATDESTLVDALPRFFAEQDAPALLAIKTPRVYNAEVLKNYFTGEKP